MKKLCLRCQKPRHHSDHNLGLCDYLTPATNSLERQRQEAAERRGLEQVHRDVLRRDGGCVLRGPEAVETAGPCVFFGEVSA